MNNYVTGLTIKQLREKRSMTQAELAEKIGVSSKTVSKWETAKGLPDISLLQPLAQALGISVMELMNGEHIINQNISANLLRSKLYVCPICGNAIHSTGSALVSCCGITLPALESEDADGDHTITIETVEDEHFITIHHPMTKQHFISFVAFVTSDRVQLVKLYPESEAQTRLQLRGWAICTITAISTVCFGKRNNEQQQNARLPIGKRALLCFLQREPQLHIAFAGVFLAGRAIHLKVITAA